LYILIKIKKGIVNTGIDNFFKILDNLMMFTLTYNKASKKSFQIFQIVSEYMPIISLNIVYGFHERLFFQIGVMKNYSFLKYALI